MKAYSIDLCTKIVESVRKGVAKSETARRFGVNRSTVKRYLKRLDEGDSLALKKRIVVKFAVGKKGKKVKSFMKTRWQQSLEYHWARPRKALVMLRSDG